MNIDLGDANRRVTAATVGYALMALGLAITLLAVALDAWTNLGELELISACMGLISSIVAAVILASDTVALSAALPARSVAARPSSPERGG